MKGPGRRDSDDRAAKGGGTVKGRFTRTPGEIEIHEGAGTLSS